MRKGTKTPIEIRNKLSFIHKMKLCKCHLKKRKLTKKWKKAFLAGRDRYILGRPLTEEHKRKISLHHKMNGVGKWQLGRKHPKYAIEKIRKASVNLWKKEWYRNRMTGKNSPMWKGGKSFEPYPLTFTRKLRREIRERDNNECQMCKIHQKKLNYKLHVHHIDYDKKNCKEGNLVALCRNCHLRTNFNRENWRMFFIFSEIT